MADQSGKWKIAVLAVVAITAGLGAYLLWGQSWRGPKTGESITIHGLELKRDYSNGILAVEFSYKNQTETPVALAPPMIMLETGGGEMVDLFSLPNANPNSRAGISVDPGKEERTALKFWLKPEHLNGELFLVSKSERAMVKSKTPIDITAVANTETVQIKSVDWPLKEPQP